MASPPQPVASDDNSSVNWLFMDLNAYFASVEQQERPELRGCPVAVIPMLTDHTCCIAASYEAKAFGIKTGTMVRDARQACPGLKIVEARPEVYVRYHHAIVDAVEGCIPVTAVVSIDEMACRFMGRERQVAAARQIACNLKSAIRDKVGSTLRCSIGLAPNRLLAKVASDMQKPDGLTVITPADLPAKLFALQPSDIPGIGQRMNKRLENQGILTMEQLYALSPGQMRQLWSGVVGERMWRWLRGEDFEIATLLHRSVGHQHVLPPDLRTRDLAYAVCKKLLHKAGARLRKLKMWAGGIATHVYFLDGMPAWEAHADILECQDTITLVEALQRLWEGCPAGKPIRVGVVLYGLVPDEMHTLSLLQEEEQKRGNLAQVMDRVYFKYGIDKLYLGGIHKVRSAAPTRISFTSIPEFF